jgi:hypothetical protein
MTVQTEIPGVHMEAYIALPDLTRSNRTDIFDSHNKSIVDRPVEGCRISASEDQIRSAGRIRVLHKVRKSRRMPSPDSTLCPPPSSHIVPRLRNLCAFTTSTTHRQASSHGCDAWTGPDRITRQQSTRTAPTPATTAAAAASACTVRRRSW